MKVRAFRRASLLSLIAAACVLQWRPLVAPARADEAPGGESYSSAADAQKKSPIPTPAALQSANAMIAEVYKDDLLAAKTPAQKAALAARLVAAGAQEPDPANHYAILFKARNLAAEGLDPLTMLQAIDDLNENFECDGLKMESEGLVGLSRLMHTAEQHVALAKAAKQCTEQAMDAENFALARQMSDLCVSCSKAGAEALQKDALTLAASVRDLESATDDARRSMPILAHAPTDPVSNYHVGKYRCLYKGQWKEGLINLAMGSDRTLQQLAQKDLAGPTTPQGQLQMGDAWWDAAQQGTTLTKSHMEGRARFYYLQCVAQLAGLERAKVEKRLQETGSLDPSAPDTGGFASVILNQLPHELLPVKTDTMADLKAKFARLRTWMDGRSLDSHNGGHSTVLLYKFIGATTFTSFPSQVGRPVGAPALPPGLAASREQMRLRITFQDEFDYHGVPCIATFSVARNVTGRNDPKIKGAQALEVGATYEVTSKVTTFTISYLIRTTRNHATGATETSPAIGLKMVCDTGQVDAKLRTHALH